MCPLQTPGMGALDNAVKIDVCLLLANGDPPLVVHAQV